MPEIILIIFFWYIFLQLKNYYLTRIKRQNSFKREQEQNTKVLKILRNKVLTLTIKNLQTEGENLPVTAKKVLGKKVSRRKILKFRTYPFFLSLQNKVLPIRDFI